MIICFMVTLTCFSFLRVSVLSHLYTAYIMCLGHARKKRNEKIYVRDRLKRYWKVKKEKSWGFSCVGAELYRIFSAFDAFCLLSFWGFRVLDEILFLVERHVTIFV